MNQIEGRRKLLNKYCVSKTLGKGLNKVKLVYDTSDGLPRAAKICKGSLRVSSLKNEANVLQELNRLKIPHVVNCIEFLMNEENSFWEPLLATDEDINQDKKYIYKAALIMELAPNSTIFAYLSRHGPFEEKIARFYFTQLITTIQQMHEHHICHRDLKLENMLLDEHFSLQLCDFGFAQKFDDVQGDIFTEKLGTERYLAPEIFLARKFSGKKADIFACGVILFMLVTGRPPFFKATSTDTFYQYFASRNEVKFWESNQSKKNNNIEYDSSFKKLVNDLLCIDPDKRPEAKEIFNYEWMKRETYTESEVFELMAKGNQFQIKQMHPYKSKSY